MLHPSDLRSFGTFSTSTRWRPDGSAPSIAALQQLDSLRKLPAAELRRVAPLCTLRAFEPGTVLYAEHSIARTLLIVLQGSVTLLRGDGAGDHVLLALLGRGDIFGEGGLFGGRYRRITARAETRVILLQIAYDELNPLLPSVPEFAAQLRYSYRERLLQTTLARVPLFAALTAIERLTLANELDERHIERGAPVEQSGLEGHHWGESLHIIAEGQATVVRDGRRIAMLNPGDFFGEMELLHVGAPEAEIVALTPLHILTLPGATCTHLLREHPAIAEGMREIARARLAQGTDQARIDVTEKAIEAGVVRGRQVLARIPALCPPGCNLCEQACADRHGAPRIRLNGTTFGPIDVPTGCVHCTWSPECAEACPEDAIELGDDGFLFVNDRCTGCGACAEACPYDAISMIPLYPPVSGLLDWTLRRVRRPEPLRMHANKCDGCHGYSDQACLSICPTGSLRWVNEEDLHPEEPTPVS
ncbi:MAG: cyclic nucleotide-binding domain-containing protein [Chloroflexota bacterium]|nr:cyclic nucleotide-binding domain-containing protein [Chloroflexota bacterium]